jgi:hypothetical protein
MPSEREPDKEGLVDQTFASWNRIKEWVRRLEQLRKVV